MCSDTEARLVEVCIFQSTYNSFLYQVTGICIFRVLEEERCSGVLRWQSNFFFVSKCGLALLIKELRLPHFQIMHLLRPMSYFTSSDGHVGG